MRSVTYPFEEFYDQNSTDLEFLGQFADSNSSNFYLFNVDKNAYYKKYESRGFSDEFKSLFNAMCC